MCCHPEPSRFQKLCRAIARREQILVEISRLGSYRKERIAELTGEAAHWEHQIQTMRSQPGYDILVDPLEIVAKDGHAECRAELNQLRSEIVQCRAKKDGLFELNGLLRGEIRKLRPSRRALERAPAGRPTAKAARTEELRFLLEAYIGLPLPSPNGYQLLFSRAALERVLGLLKQAEQLSGQILQMRPPPVTTAHGQRVPLTSLVAGS